MNNDIYGKTHKRISELYKFDDTAGDPLAPIIVSRPDGNNEAEHWMFTVDRLLMDGVSDDTFRIPMSRIVLLGPQRRIPAVNLPSFISPCNGCVEVDELPGEGDISLVYMVIGEGSPFKYYRWIRGDDVYENTGWVPIATNYRLVNGAATVIEESGERATTKFNVTIGNPCVSREDGNPLAIENNQLVHVNSGVIAGQTVTPILSDSLPFGGTFNVPRYSTDSTGHVTGLPEPYELVFPATIADNSTAGLIYIGDGTAYIGSTKSAGDYLSGIAAADHQHRASLFTFENLAGESQTYAMHSDTSIDFTGILCAAPPANSPGGGMYLSSTGSLGNATSWKSLYDVLPPSLETKTATAMAEVSEPTVLQTITVKSNRLYIVSIALDISRDDDATDSALASDYICKVELIAGEHVYARRYANISDMVSTVDEVERLNLNCLAYVEPDAGDDGDGTTDVSLVMTICSEDASYRDGFTARCASLDVAELK